MTTKVYSAGGERQRELQQHLGHLDALRGLAAMGVISSHAAILVPNVLAPYLSVPGGRGLQLFFVLSAFTLMLSWQNRSRDRRPTLFFFIRRFFRLAPLYYLMTAAMVLLEPSERTGWANKWPSLFFMQNLSRKNYGSGPQVGWSLSVEFLFYLCFPLLASWITSLRRAVYWLFAAIPISTIIWTTAARVNPADLQYWSYFSFVVQIPTFLLGFVCFFLWRDYIQAIAKMPEAKWLSACLLLLTVTILAAVIPIDPAKVFFNSIFMTTLLLAVCVYEWRFLINRFTIMLGKISYGVYLIHGLLLLLTMPRVRFYAQMVHSPSARVLLWAGYFLELLLTSMVFAAGTYYLVEEPGIRLGKHLIRRLGGGIREAEPQPHLLSDRDSAAAQF